MRGPRALVAASALAVGVVVAAGSPAHAQTPPSDAYVETPSPANIAPGPIYWDLGNELLSKPLETLMGLINRGS